MISIGTRIGAITTGAPAGKKKVKKCTPCLMNATIVTSRNTKIANAKVTTI